MSGKAENEVRTVLAMRLASLGPQPWKVRVDWTDAGSVVVDCRDGALTEDSTGDTSVDCVLHISSGDFAKLLSGELNLRYALMYRDARVVGSAKTATKFGDWLAGNYFEAETSLSVSSLPRPTSDVSIAWDHLAQFGYAIVENALGPDQLKAVRTRLVDQAAAEDEFGCAVWEGGNEGHGRNQRLWSLINKGTEFMELLDHPLIDEFALKSVGEHFCIGSYFSVIAGPGGTGAGLHFDQMSLVPPIPNINIGLNIVFFLDEFTEANGATRVLPRSHLPENHIAPENVLTHEGTVPAEGPAGSALIFDSRLWHGTGANKTDQSRHGLFLFFIRHWMRANENPYLSAHPSVVERMSDRVKTMYGLRHTSSLGRIGATREGSIVRYAPDDLIMEMHPSSAAHGSEGE